MVLVDLSLSSDYCYFARFVRITRCILCLIILHGFGARKHGPAGMIVIGGNSWRDAAIARWGLAWRSHLDSECVFKYGIEEN